MLYMLNADTHVLCRKSLCTVYDIGPQGACWQQLRYVTQLTVRMVRAKVEKLLCPVQDDCPAVFAGQPRAGRAVCHI